ncbi:DNA-binding protein [Bradyrhizobium sp. McL0616]|uniref:helix-turn-helix domain-containing transcriptional regulator n=1 Tax=Bradyrhizobium sp. McL0616 TaxID=3415674 RepID=UPI003CF66DC6
MQASNKAILAELFRDNPAEISAYLTEKFKENNIDAARMGLSLVVQAQNVQMVARDAGLRRDTLYRTFGGRIDPQLSRTLKLFEALNVRAWVVPSAPADLQPVSSPLNSPDLDALARRLNQALAGNNSNEVILALREVALSQNVSALARAVGTMRTTVYKTFGGTVDPQLGRVLKLFAALNLRFTVIVLPRKRARPRPKLGRPPKSSGD